MLESTGLVDFADTRSISCDDVCRHVWEGQSKTDDSCGVLTEGEVVIMLAAWIRTSCDSGRVKYVRAECLASARDPTDLLPILPDISSKAHRSRNKTSDTLCGCEAEGKQ